MTEAKFLVLGAARGGTTILSSALGAHSQIAMLDEDMGMAFTRVTGGKIPAVKLCVPNQIELTRRWQPIFGPGMWAGRFRKSLFMSKIPKSPYSIRDYDEYGPIRHICILRHPAGVMPAVMKRENRSLAVASYRYRRCVEVFADLVADETSNPVIVSFERLVSEPEEVLRNLMDKLELPFEVQMLEAPSRNQRYTASAFDASKGVYEETDAIWSKLPDSTRSRYEQILNLAI